MTDVVDRRIEAAEIAARERQYATFVQWAEQLIDRRAEANRFYVALNMAIVGAIGFIHSDSFSGAQADPPSGSETAALPVELIAAVFAFAGVTVSLNWLGVLTSHRRIIRSKFELIRELEERLPSQPYRDEWARIRPRKGLKIVAWFLSVLLPLLFMTFHGLLFMFFAALVAKPGGVDVTGFIRAGAAKLGL